MRVAQTQQETIPIPKHLQIQMSQKGNIFVPVYQSKVRRGLWEEFKITSND